MTWIKVAAEAVSYRRMYFLAAEIVGSELATSEMRKAAKRVTRALEGVIELPIADASVLAGARRRFAVLEAVLARVPDQDMSLKKEPPGHNDRAMEIQ